MATHDSALCETAAAAPLEVPADRLLHDWREAHQRALVYLQALGLPEAEHQTLARLAIERALERPWQDGADAVSETLHALWELLPAEYPAPPRPCAGPIDRFLGWRLDAYLSARFAGGGARNGTPILPRHEGRLAATPRLARRPMVPEQIDRRAIRHLFQRLRRIRLGSRAATKHAPLLHLRRHLPWTGVAHRRRLLLAVLVLIPSTIASGFMVNVLPHQGATWIEFFIVIFFGALFGWISIGFWTALLGFLALIGKRSRFAITNLAALDEGGFRPAGRTAVVMPICEEPVARVFAGLKTIFRSLERTGTLEYFDFFILSDSSNPDTCIKEEEAWAEWCRSIGRFDKIFYRRRRVHQKRKSGNVADFCRRWGAQYGYMIMLDADSIMAGDTLVRLVQMMERSPGVGMIQTAPSAVNRRSLFARVQQFASRVYGPMFAAGLHYWQLGDGQYWGHNAIIRVAAFMAHCGLRRLPGKPPLGGDIMSHDFVEAALMGRAGWSLWLAYDLGGSYEEVPSTLLEEMGRDRRWCQGNLQHLRLLFSEGLFGAHRALFVNGVLSYVSALLWFTFLTLSTAEAIQNALHLPDYFPHGRSLFPAWPIWRPDWALYLAAVTAMILFLPKFLSIALIALKRRQAKAYGGVFRLFLSVLIEIVLSSLLAPIRMVFHSRFVVQNLLGRTVSWHSQGREDAETSWGEAIRRHGFDTVFASAWGISLYLLSPYYFWWVTPIIGALILSIPSSVLASRVRLGDRARRWGLFLIPEEGEPPEELRDLPQLLRDEERREEAVPAAEQDGFVRAAVDPYVNALHRLLLGRSRSLRPSIRAARRALLQRALADGPRALDKRARQVLLGDPDLVDELHQRVWQLAERDRAALWGRPGSSG
jgi:membrane glycosyltransferase